MLLKTQLSIIANNSPAKYLVPTNRTTMEFLKGLLGFGKPKETNAFPVPPATMGTTAAAPSIPNAPGAIPAANVAVGGRRRPNTRKHKKNSRKNRRR
jgi:hypothetical protein